MDVVCLGEAIVDIITQKVQDIRLANEYHMADEILIKTGGDAQNNAIDLATIGHHVAYVGRVSRDAGGEMIMKACTEKGVDMSHVIRTDTPQTKMNILLSEHGDRSFLYYPGVSEEFTAADFDRSLLEQTRILQFSSTFHMTAFDGELGALELMKEAKGKGVITAMDITSDFSGRWNRILAPCYPWLDYFLPSEEQAALLAGTEDPEEMARFFLSQGVGHVVIKLGARGCYCADRGTAFYCGCHDVPAKDATGAGDAFVAGFLSGVLRDAPIKKCVEIATTASAFVIQKVGANTGIRSFEELNDYLERHPLKITEKI